MNKDIRLLTSFKGHRKRKRLRSLIGDRYLDYLIDLWLTVAEDRPDGELTGWDELDIALSSGCDCNAAADANAYADALIECGFIDIDHRGYRIHDWNEHQTWASKAKIRSEAAKRAAEYRWEKRLNHLKKCGRITTAHAGAHATAKPTDTNGNAPSPSPSPSPSPKRIKRESGKNDKNPPAKKPAKIPADFMLTEKLIEFAKSQGINGNVQMIFDQFKDHHKNKGTLGLDWEAGWRTWVRNEIKFNSGKSTLSFTDKAKAEREAWMKERGLQP